MIQWYTMRPSTAHVSKLTELWCSQPTHHCPNQSHKEITISYFLCTADWAAWPAGAPACVCRLHAAAVRSTALVSDEKRIRGVYTRRCAIQIDNLYLLPLPSLLMLYSSNELGEISQWLCHDNSTINIVVNL